ncbi:putative DNA-directed RNA polymerases I and III subunit RPAC2 [Vitis vinifera]|uniref:Putative DNA-directed RNA polymerases I and III subunit RPAC2 n=1 Tax=Vitis vinifera TaxID=29760 RepID=A0A438G177_VITVI|nr:putative DNA-directed RNA polymerases I and III subunit RPAC2 [Vitis vinifera]RVW65961.1 putative DNA-directed RNA polymerases I and III subunit RPAC2 [Vitis vinifera]
MGVRDRACGKMNKKVVRVEEGMENGLVWGLWPVGFPRVAFCGYSIPHPSDARVNIRVQTTGDSAREVLKDACQDLMLMCQHVRSTFDKAVVDYKMSKPVKDMSIEK